MRVFDKGWRGEWRNGLEDGILLQLGETRRALVTILDDSPDPRGRSPRPFGLAAGEFVVPDDFDEPLPTEILTLFGAA